MYQTLKICYLNLAYFSIFFILLLTWTTSLINLITLHFMWFAIRSSLAPRHMIGLLSPTKHPVGFELATL